MEQTVLILIVGVIGFVLLAGRLAIYLLVPQDSWLSKGLDYVDTTDTGSCDPHLGGESSCDGDA